MIVTIRATNLELSNRLRHFTKVKLLDCYRAFGDMNREAVRIYVELELTSRRYLHHREDEQLYRAEATVLLPGRKLRVEASAHELEQAIVKMKHLLTRKIRRWREQLTDTRRTGARHLNLIRTSLPASVEALDSEEAWDAPTRIPEPEPEGAWELEMDLRDLV